ncbi:MAG: hypothetical protein PVI90_00155 [Desulfobacteraceae bacterium]|jgi:hypothetical protein
MIVDGSPLAIIGIFVAFLRERFTLGNGPPTYNWYEDITKTNIIIESSFEDNITTRGMKPAIYVDKDQSIYGKNIIGDRAAHRFKDSKDAQWCLSTVPILIDCVSSRKGESAIIGDITQWSIHVASDVIQKVFSLHDMSPPTLGRTIPYEDDQETWTTPISFQVQYNVRWTVIPVAPLLSDISLKIQNSGMSTNDYLLELVVRSNDTLPDS